MELPRGRFMGVRRNARLTFLLKDLSDNRFTGHCQITYDRSVMVPVLKKGTIILAGYRNLGGDGALDAIYSCRNMLVDAQLNELNEPQMQLALEFNPGWKVSESYAGDCRVISHAEEKEVQSGPGSRSKSSADHCPLPSPEREVSDEGMPMPRIKDRAENVDEWKKDTALSVASEGFEDSMGIVPALECGNPVTPDWKQALTMPFILTSDSSSSFPMEERVENIPEQKPVVAFEPLENDSILFETRPVVNVRRLMNVPDLPEQWRSMSINRSENSSV
jgi:hypothetical protein